MDICGNRPEPATSVGVDPSQQPPSEHNWSSILHQSRPDAMTSTEALTREQPLRDQANIRDFCGIWHKPGTLGSRPKSVTSIEVGPSQGHLRNRSEPVTTTGAGPRKRSPQEQVKRSHRPKSETSVDWAWVSEKLPGSSPELATSTGAGLS